MAKQTGIIQRQRTIQHIVFYKWRDVYCLRTKSTLSGKRVKEDKRFAKTMDNASLFAKASVIGSAVYQALPGYWRQFWMYRAFTGEAMNLLKEGKAEDEVTLLLKEIYVMKYEVRSTKYEEKKDQMSNIECPIMNEEVKKKSESREDRKPACRQGRSESKIKVRQHSLPIAIGITTHYSPEYFIFRNGRCWKAGYCSRQLSGSRIIQIKGLRGGESLINFIHSPSFRLKIGSSRQRSESRINRIKGLHGGIPMKIFLHAPPSGSRLAARGKSLNRGLNRLRDCTEGSR